MNNLAVKNNMLANKKRKGFTLVELIVVIVVIAIIAAIAIPRIVAFQDSARKARIQAEHRELVTAIQLYIASNPNTEKTSITLGHLAPYMNLNGATVPSDITQATTALTNHLAQDKDTSAHVIANGVLTSSFTAAAASTGTNATENWIYDCQ